MLWFAATGSGPRTRVMIIVSGTKMAIRNVRIDLGSGNIAVPKQGLHRARISPMLQQVSSKAVTQRVWRNILQPDLFGVSLDHGPRKLARKRLAMMQKKIGIGRLPETSFYRHVFLQPVDRTLPNRNATLFAALAVTINHAGVKIDFRLFQRHHFGN